MGTVDGDPSSVVHFDMPSEVRYLHLLRVSVATTAMELEPSMERLDDLRLAVDELATSVIRAACRGARLAVAVELQGQTVRVRGRVAADQDDPVVSEVGSMLLSRLCRDHRLDRQGRDHVFEMTMEMD